MIIQNLIKMLLMEIRFLTRIPPMTTLLVVFLSLASIIKQANPKATVFGPTSANWWYYWSNDYSPLCPITEANEDARVDDPGWQTMSHVENQWNRDIFPDRGNDPEITADSYGIKTMILKRFKNMIDSYYPGIKYYFLSMTISTGAGIRNCHRLPL